MRINFSQITRIPWLARPRGLCGNGNGCCRPGPSEARVHNRQPEQRTLTPVEKAEKLVIEAKNAKARIFPNLGRSAKLINVNQQQSTAMMDKDYLVVGGHIDESMETKIVNGEYVDFGKLLPRDKIIVEEDNRLELVIKNGKTFLVTSLRICFY